MELTFNESFVLRVFREFDFLRRLGYTAVSVSIQGREPGVVFSNKLLNRWISVSWEGSTIISLNRARWFTRSRRDTSFYLSDYYKFFDVNPTPNDDLAVSAKLLSTRLLKIVNGQVWIDELLEKGDEIDTDNPKTGQ